MQAQEYDKVKRETVWIYASQIHNKAYILVNKIAGNLLQKEGRSTDGVY